MSDGDSQKGPHPWVLTDEQGLPLIKKSLGSRYSFSRYGQYVIRRNERNSIVSMQDHHNLLYREEEWEMLELCQEEGIALIPWAPLARGGWNGRGEKLARSLEQLQIPSLNVYSSRLMKLTSKLSSVLWI